MASSEATADFNRFAPRTDDEATEMMEKYEFQRLSIEKLKAEIQTFRQQNRSSVRHGILSDEYSNYLHREQEKLNSEELAEQKETELKQANDQRTANNVTPNSGSSNNNFSFQHKCKLFEYRKLSGHGNKVYCADWSPASGSNDLVSVGRDGKIIFWNWDTGMKRLAYSLDTEFIMTVKYSPNGRHVACGGLDDTLSIFPSNMDETGLCKDVEPVIFRAHTGYISSLAYIDNDRILTASGDATIREWNVENNAAPTNTFKIHREDVMSLSVNPKNNNLILSGSVDATVKIMDLRSKEFSKVAHSFYMGYDQDFRKKNYRDTDVNIVKWFPDGTSFVAGCDGGTVRLFDIRSARMLNAYSYHNNYLNVKGDNKRILMNNNDGGGTQQQQQQQQQQQREEEEEEEEIKSASAEEAKTATIAMVNSENGGGGGGDHNRLALNNG